MQRGYFVVLILLGACSTLLAGCGKGGFVPVGDAQACNNGSYYITRQYYCSNGGDCIHTTRSCNSCQEAQEAQERRRREPLDPCQNCTGAIDRSRYVTGYDAIHDGPCRGWSRQNHQTRYAKSSWPTPEPTRQIAANISFKLTTKFLHLKRIAANPMQDNSIASCRRECSVGSANCLRVQVGSTERAGLVRLQQLVATNPPVISKSDILAMFNQSSDACDREDTMLQGGFLENRGAQCDMTTSMPGSDVTISLPELLRGKLATSSGGIEAVFDDSATRAGLHFSDTLLESDWGGNIVGVFTEGEFVGFSVGTKSCVRANLN